MIAVYGKPNGFKHADGSAAGAYVNQDPGLNSGIDRDIAGQFDQGICAGITTCWVIAFLSDVPEAADPAQFRDYYDNMLQFQGAYVFKYKSDNNISTSATGMSGFLSPFTELGMPPGVHQTNRESVRMIGSSIFPAGDWAAYTVIPGHAIGIGAKGGRYFIMDPNYGLHSYSNMVDFILDINYLYYAYRTCFNLAPTDLITLFFHAAGSRPRR